MSNYLEKLDYILELFDLYKDLLTLTQKEYLNSYYIYDLSLSEIAGEYKVSRTAVLSCIKQGVKKLEYLEKSLKLKKKLDELKSEQIFRDNIALIDKIFKEY